MIVFFSTLLQVTDYGACCTITPYLDFVNPETSPMDPLNYTAQHYHSIPRGVQNGRNGFNFTIFIFEQLLLKARLLNEITINFHVS